jgi:hypothetical protein
MTHHKLKTDSDVFQSVFLDIKKYEIRFNDRKFSVDDKLTLKETIFTGEEMSDGKPLEYTGSEIYAKVTHILEGPVYGLSRDWVIMSIVVLDRRN